MREILLIDDDPVINFIHKKIIESKFPEIPVEILVNGYNALEYIRKNTKKLFLIFLDINMPVMNGWEFLDAISKDSNEYNLTICILTSSIDQADLRKAQENERILSYITKPLTKEVLEKIY